MKRKVVTTADGSTTIHLEDWNEHYHSMHGAIQEAYHVFIDRGLSTFNTPSLTILEMGFGTGLNALITLLEAEKRKVQIGYTGIEAFPVPPQEITLLNYITALKIPAYQEKFNDLHSGPWERSYSLSDYFTLEKRHLDIRDFRETNSYDLIYFDAFGARVQPELWTEPIFKKMFLALKDSGVLVTYAAKGSVRRAMQAVGFEVERLPGPPGKREMLRGTKTGPAG